VDTSPTLVTPLLGTPTSGVLTNCTGLPAAAVVAGTLGTGAYTMDTSLTVPKVIGGTATTSDLILQTTSGIGTTGADMHFLVGNNGGTEAATILNSGFVGLNTTAPTSRLHIVGDGTATAISTVENDGNQAIMSFAAWGDQQWHSGSFSASRGRGTKAVPSYPLSGDSLFNMNIGGWNGSSMALDNGARMAFNADATWTSTSTPGSISFAVNDGTTNWNGGAKSMVFKSTGRLGIQNTSPSALLSLGTAGTTAGTLSLDGATSGTATIVVSATAGTPTITLPTVTSTLATMVLPSPIRLMGYTVAGLPAGTQGDTAFVTDATAPTYNGALTGGGAVVVPVFYNGTAWVSA